MPVLTVTVVLEPAETSPPKVAKVLARAAGRVFGSPPGSTWVRLWALTSDQYAEDGDDSGPPPVFVSVLKSQPMDPSKLSREALDLTSAIAATLNRPLDRVHVIYEPAAKGRAAFGGRFLEP